MKEFFSIVNLTKSATPRLPFQFVKEKILGKKYRLSLVVANTNCVKKLNRFFRRKNSVTNVLSFPLSRISGEIFLHLGTIRNEARAQKILFLDHLMFIYIHGLLHLNGLRHGTKMETLEKKYLRLFSKKLSK